MSLAKADNSNPIWDDVIKHIPEHKRYIFNQQEQTLKTTFDLLKNLDQDVAAALTYVAFKRTNPWITTFTGKHFHQLNPSPNEICIEDIAHGLSNMCRYNGQCTPFYSVAQHSIELFRIVPEELRPVALFHDASEAYIHDITSLLKEILPQYLLIESNITKAIFEKFSIDYDRLQFLKPYEDILVATEVHNIDIDITPINSEKWDLPLTLTWNIDIMSSKIAEALFEDVYINYIKES